VHAKRCRSAKSGSQSCKRLCSRRFPALAFLFAVVRSLSLSVPPGSFFERRENAVKTTCMLAASPRGVAGDPRCVVSVGAVSGSGKWARFRSPPSPSLSGYTMRGQLQTGKLALRSSQLFCQACGKLPGFCQTACQDTCIPRFKSQWPVLPKHQSPFR